MNQCLNKAQNKGLLSECLFQLSHITLIVIIHGQLDQGLFFSSIFMHPGSYSYSIHVFIGNYSLKHAHVKRKIRF